MYQTTVTDDDRAKTDSEEVLTDESALLAELEESLKDYSPLCFVRILSMKYGNCRWNKIKKEIILSLNKNPSLLIFLHSVNYQLIDLPTKKCTCSFVTGDTSIITLNISRNVETKQKMSGLCIPSRHEFYVNPFYYLRKEPITLDYKIAAFNNSDKKESISSVNDMIFKLIDNKLRSVCLIFLGEYDCLYNEMIYLAKCLKDSDATRQIPIIGGTMNDLMFCDSVTCRFKVNGIIITIKGFFMKAWTLSFKAACRTKEEIRMKFFEFKNRVKLKSYSFGYMYFSKQRSQSLVNFEKKIFKETFPTVDLFTIYGASGYAADDVNGMLINVR